MSARQPHKREHASEQRMNEHTNEREHEPASSPTRSVARASARSASSVERSAFGVERLPAFLHADAPPVVSISVKKPNGKWRSYLVRTEHLEEFLESRKDSDVYYEVGLPKPEVLVQAIELVGSRRWVRTDSRFRSDQVDKFTVVFADVDYKDPNAKPDDVLSVLDDLNLLPYSTVVFSGRGYHVYVHFEEPVDAKRWDELEEAFVKLLESRGLPVDPKVKDRARVLRVVGTLNTKSGKLVEYVKVAEDVLNPDGFGSLVGIELQELEEAKERELAEREKKLEQVIADLVKGVNFTSFRCCGKDFSRSEVAFDVAKIVAASLGPKESVRQVVERAVSSWVWPKARAEEIISKQVREAFRQVEAALNGSQAPFIDARIAHLVLALTAGLWKRSDGEWRLAKAFEEAVKRVSELVVGIVDYYKSLKESGEPSVFPSVTAARKALRLAKARMNAGLRKAFYDMLEIGLVIRYTGTVSSKCLLFRDGSVAKTDFKKVEADVKSCAKRLMLEVDELARTGNLKVDKETLEDWLSGSLGMLVEDLLAYEGKGVEREVVGTEAGVFARIRHKFSGALIRLFYSGEKLLAYVNGYDKLFNNLAMNINKAKLKRGFVLVPTVLLRDAELIFGGSNELTGAFEVAVGKSVLEALYEKVQSFFDRFAVKAKAIKGAAAKVVEKVNRAVRTVINKAKSKLSPGEEGGGSGEDQGKPLDSERRGELSDEVDEGERRGDERMHELGLDGEDDWDESELAV